MLIEEAIDKWCPERKRFEYIQDIEGNSMWIDNGKSNCINRDCMMWVWDKEIDSGLHIKESMTNGHCGLVKG